MKITKVSQLHTDLPPLAPLDKIESDIPQESNKAEDIICPFCKWADFDLIGLKMHILRGHCDVFNNT